MLFGWPAVLVGEIKADVGSWVGKYCRGTIDFKQFMCVNNCNVKVHAFWAFLKEGKVTYEIM